MTNHPVFEKKELALSSSPYVYLPVAIPTYTVEVSHREEIDGELLQRALERTLRRMPYLADTMIEEGGKIYYAKNPLPMEAAHCGEIRPVGGEATNYHLLDLTWDGNKTRFSMYHGFCDGQGINAFLESVLYHYYCMKDGVEYDANGIRSDKTPLNPAEEFDPCTRIYEVSPDFTMPDRRQAPSVYHLPELAPTQSNTVLEYGFRLPSAEFVAYAKANGASPAVLLAMLMGEAVLRVHPEADKMVQAQLPISVRRMLGCEETFKNCSSISALPVGGTPLDALPFAERAARLRALLKQQMGTELFHAVYNYIGSVYRKRMDEATDYREEIRKPAAFMTRSSDTFYIDYIGSLHKTAYADQITDVRFLCKPAGGAIPHLNMIEHAGEFRITCLSCFDIAPLADALEQAMREHGLTVARVETQSFTLPKCEWLDSVLKGILCI